jgi:hypothetical protein
MLLKNLYKQNNKMKKENLLYVITDKSNRPQKRGNSRKCAWTSPRWVNYHIGRNRWNLPGDSHPAKNYNVNVINLSTGTINVVSGIAFVESTKNPEIIKNEILSKFGFSVYLQSLVAMYTANVFTDIVRSNVRNFLLEKGINC